MRKKLISKTYLRGVEQYNLKILFNNDDYYCSIKEIIKVKSPFILSTGLCLIDNDYYIVEIIPKNENYSIRAFLNNSKQLLQYYIDISLGNGLDTDVNIPYYDDLFLDIIITDGQIDVVDDDELINALNNNEITINDYNLAIETKNKLLKEIENNSNKYLNIDLNKLI